MTDTVAKLGDIIEVYCSRCRLNLDANIAAVGADKPLKVQCRTCWNIVDFKPPKDMEEKRRKKVQRLMKLQEKKRDPSTERRAPVADSDVKAEWKAKTADFDIRYARPYDRHRAYEAGAFLLDKKFGVGVVESTKDGAMIVLFRDVRMELEQQQPREEE